MRFQHILVVDDDLSLAETVVNILAASGLTATAIASSAEAARVLPQGAYDLVISDIHMPGMTGLQLLRAVAGTMEHLPPFIFVTGAPDASLLEKASLLGAVDTISKPFTAAELLQVIAHMDQRLGDLLSEVMATMEQISGVTLGEGKRGLVETRVMRRARQLGLPTLHAYLGYFARHRATEIPELVSLVTTHYTDFFRETPHFDWLMEDALPRLVQRGGPVIRIWSAAASTGEEAYSLAIAYLEYLREQGRTAKDAPRLELIGTDIDPRSVAHAAKGIYEQRRLNGIPPSLVKRYFDSGTGPLANLVRVKDAVHQLCRFSVWNLLGEQPPTTDVDVIFLRNVLIYFQKPLVARIVTSMTRALANPGHLVVGHSESLSGLEGRLKTVGNSIYQLGQPASRQATGSTLDQAAVPPAAGPAGGVAVKVFIIDDSPTIRALVRSLLSKSDGGPGFTVVGEAENPVDAAPLLAQTRPDVVTLDIHMPKMDGLSYLRSLKPGQEHPPVVMLSSVGFGDGYTAVQCLELGAVDYVEKPAAGLSEEGDRLRAVLQAAARRRHRPQLKSAAPSSPAVHAPAPAAKGIVYRSGTSGRELILIGASTGGVEAVRAVLSTIPASAPPVLIVQHIPAAFSRAYAQSLDRVGAVRVAEARDGEVLVHGRAYVAPGGLQFGVRAVGSDLRATVGEAPPVNRHKPSVDYLFDSAVALPGDVVMVAALLTGMGNDGARGLLALRQRGVHTVAQNEESCIVYGMPKVAVELGAAVEIAALHAVTAHLLAALAGRGRQAA